MADISGGSSTPAPMRGQLWRHRRDGTYIVVTNIFAGRVVTYGGETTPTVPDFVRENEYVGDFDGSRWLSGGSLYTVRLMADDSVGTVDEDGDFLPIVFNSFRESFVFLPATPEPARGQLWRHKRDGTFTVVTNIYAGRVTTNANALVTGTSTVSDFVRENDYIGEFNGSQWSYRAVNPNIILTVRLNEENSVTAMYRSGSETETLYFQYVAFYFEKVYFQSAGPVSSGSAPRLSAPDPIGVAGGSDEDSAGAGGPASGSGTSRSAAAAASSVAAQSDLQGFMRFDFSETHTDWRVTFTFRNTPVESSSALSSYLDGWMGDWRWPNVGGPMQTDGIEQYYDGQRRLNPNLFTNRMRAPPNSTRLRVLTNGEDNENPRTYSRVFQFWIPKSWDNLQHRIIEVFIEKLLRHFGEFPESNTRFFDEDREVLVTLTRDSSLVAGSAPRLAAPDPIGVGSDEESAGAGGPASGSGTSRSGAASSSSSSSSSSPAPARGKKRKRSVETVRRKMPSAVYKAATSGDIEAIEKMIKEENLDINEQFVGGVVYEGQFILVEAILRLRVELVEFLLKNGANTEIVFIDMGTTRRPLELVVLLATKVRLDKFPSRQKIIDLLLEYGADTRRAIKIAERHERKARLDEPYPLLLQLLRYGPRDGVSECPICFEPLSGHGVRDSFIKLSCGHMFHRACIQRWVSDGTLDYSTNFSCPSCRATIAKTELEGDGARYVAASLKRDGTIVYKLGQDLKF